MLFRVQHPAPLARQQQNTQQVKISSRNSHSFRVHGGNLRNLSKYSGPLFPRHLICTPPIISVAAARSESIEVMGLKVQNKNLSFFPFYDRSVLNRLNQLLPNLSSNLASFFCFIYFASHLLGSIRQQIQNLLLLNRSSVQTLEISRIDRVLTVEI